MTPFVMVFARLLSPPIKRAMVETASGGRWWSDERVAGRNRTSEKTCRPSTSKQLAAATGRGRRTGGLGRATFRRSIAEEARAYWQPAIASDNVVFWSPGMKRDDRRHRSARVEPKEERAVIAPKSTSCSCIPTPNGSASAANS